MKKQNNKNKDKFKTKNNISANIQGLFDQKQILQKQKYLVKMFQQYSQHQQTLFHQKIKYQQTIFQKGDDIQLYSPNIQESYVAKLTNIIQLPKNIYAKPFIEVEWTMKKHDLPENILKQYGECISQAQVFPTKQKIYLYVQSIKQKCTILTIAQYGQLGITNEGLYYSRSNFNRQKNKLRPDPSTWNSECYCGRPENPDLKYIQCSKCQRWFHEKCVLERIINNSFLCMKCI